MSRLIAWLGSVFVQILDMNIVDVEVSPTNASAGYQLNADGFVYKATGGAYVQQTFWVAPQGIAASYEARATLTGGVTPTNGALNTWQGLNVTRSWENIRSALGNQFSDLLIEIRDGSGTVRASANIHIEAEKD